jgi:hypothetical protein
LYDLLRPMAHEAAIRAVHNEKRIRRIYGKEFTAVAPSLSSATSGTSTPTGRGSSKASAKKYDVRGRAMYVTTPGRDIYGNEKPTDARYFQCSNCERKIAGNRFAAHIVRCLSGRNSRLKGNQVNGVYNSPSTSPPSEPRSSPAKRKLGEDGAPKSQVSKFFDRAKKPHKSLPPSRHSSPPVADRSMVSMAYFFLLSFILTEVRNADTCEWTCCPQETTGCLIII